MKQLLRQVFNWKNPLQSLLLVALLILVTQIIAFPAHATGVAQMPNLTAGDRTWVVDQAEVLSRISEGKISKTFEDLAKNTGNEVRFVTIRRFDYGENADSFIDQLFAKWFPTAEAQANQTLIVIDTLSSGSAIRVGDQAKSLLTDDIAKSVVAETLLLPLKEGDKYNQAFTATSDRLVAVLSGNPDPGPPQVVEASAASTFKNAEETDANNATVWVVALLAAATIIPMATYYLYVK